MTPDRAYGLYDRPVETLSTPEILDVPPCIVCEGTRARPAFRVTGVASPIVVCDVCGLGYYHPMPDRDEVASFYPPSYYGEPGAKFRPLVEELVRFVGRRHVRFLSRDLPKGARVLDVGCGRGVLLGPLAEMGFVACGVEMNEEARRGADPRAEIRIASRLADAGYEAGSFDEVILWHVLEHLPDPRETLAECRKLLRVGGKILVSLPNFASAQARFSGAAWFHLDPPRHLFHFPVEGLRRLLERTGFQTESVHHFSLRQNPFGWIQSALNRSSRWPRNALYTLLYHSGERGPELGLLDRALLWGAFLLGSPVALGLSAVMAAARRGATVHIVARRES